jgi:precorrin-6B methylase 2
METPFDKNQADQLLSKGAITQDQYNTAFPALNQPLFDPANFAPAPAPAPALAPVVQAAPVVAPPSGFDLQSIGLAQAGIAAQNQAKADQDAINAIEKQANEVQVKRQAAEDAALKRAEVLQTKQQDALEELSKINISPDNYWAKKSTGDSIGVGIALILGAFGAAGGGGNKAADVINTAIDRDVETQKANYLTKKSAAAEAGNTYAKMYDVYKDELAATAATKAALINQAQLKIQSNAAKFKGDTATAAATSALGQLQSVRDAETLKLQQSKAYGEDPQFAGMDEETRERYIPKSNIPFMPFGKASLGTPEDVSKFRAESNDVADAIDSLKKLQDMIDLGATQKFSFEQKAAAQTLQQTTVGKLRTAVLGPGIINEQERAIMEQMIANPTDLLSLDSKNKSRLQALTNSMINSVNRKGVSLGLKNSAPESLQRSLGFKEEK